MAVYKCSANTFYFQIEHDFLENRKIKMNKKRMLLCLVIFDTITAIIMIAYIRKLIELNRDKVKEIQHNIEEAKDSSIMIENIPIDKYSQDSRILKMKIWLQLKKQVEGLNGNNNQILDINLSPNKAYHLNFIFMMTDIQNKIQKIEAKLNEKLSDEKRECLNTHLEKLYKRLLGFANIFQKDLHKKISDKEIFQKVEFSVRSSKLDFAIITLNNPCCVSKL